MKADDIYKELRAHQDPNQKHYTDAEIDILLNNIAIPDRTEPEEWWNNEKIRPIQKVL